MIRVKLQPPLIIALSLIYLAILSGCANQARVTNLTPLDTWDRKVHSFVDPDANFQKYQTFALVPYSEMIGKTSLNPIAERQMLFFLRSVLENRGYRYVNAQDSADFVITIDADNEYREHYVPQQTVQVPVWVPSMTTTSTTTKTGDITANGSEDYASGNYNEKSSTETTTPGHIETGTETRGGYTVGYYYPRVSIFAYDAKSSKNIYEADGTAMSKNDDVRIACEFLAGGCTKDIPSPASDYELCPPLKGIAGINIGIVTTDGNSFWPAAVSITPNSPAENAGIVYGDIILSINGVDMRNKDVAYFKCALRGDPGAIRNLIIWRMGERIPISITMMNRDELNKKK